MSVRRQIPMIHKPHDSSKLSVYIPWVGYAGRYVIYDAIGKSRVSCVWDADDKTYKVSANYLEVLVDKLSEQFGAVELYIDSEVTESCTSACQGASQRTVYICQCSCGGQFHGGGQPDGSGLSFHGTERIAFSSVQRVHWTITSESFVAA